MFGRATIVLLAIGALPASAWASCGATFCTVNTDWSVQEAATQPGWRMDLRFEYVDQDQPRQGTNDVSVGHVPRHHDEVRTINRNWLLGVAYTFDKHWGVSVDLPVVSRTHTHIHNHHGAQIVDRWNFTDVGDIRVLGRYQFTGGALQPQASGIRFGFKLPTGPFDVANSEGEEAERSLQPGTGTTDFLIGGYYQRNATRWPGSWFAQILYQYPLQERDRYRPGNQLQMDVGARYRLTDSLSALWQFNAHYKGKDRGDNAESQDTGSRMLAVSPGLGYQLTPQVQMFGFVQLPVYQDVNGVQITADWYATVGVSARF